MIKEMETLTETEISHVFGGINLSDEAESNNYEYTVREGPFLVTYNSAGQCIKAVWAPAPKT